MTRETHYDHLFESQTQYRALLDCMAKPGTLATLKANINAPHGIHKASVLLGFALLNSDVSFFKSNDDSQDIANYFIQNVASSPAQAKDADFIFITGQKSETSHIALAKIGFPEYPEFGAFVVVDVETISTESLDNSIQIVLKGPGVQGDKNIYIAGLSADVIEAILDKNIEYPLGVDTILTDKAGNIVCIPRSNSFKYIA